MVNLNLKIIFGLICVYTLSLQSMEAMKDGQAEPAFFPIPARHAALNPEYFAAHPATQEAVNEKSEICAICREKCEGLHTAELACGHKFCGCCIEKWISHISYSRPEKTCCPTCKLPAKFKPGTARCDCCRGDVNPATTFFQGYKCNRAKIAGTTQGSWFKEDVILHVHNECLLDHLLIFEEDKKPESFNGGCFYYEKGSFYYICTAGHKHTFTARQAEILRNVLKLPINNPEPESSWLGTLWTWVSIKSPAS